MAKPSSARQSGNVASTARSTRSTRSQSAEPSEPAPAPRTSPRKASRPVSKPAPKRRGRPAKNSATDLETVEEDAAVEDQLAADMHAAPDAPSDGIDLARRISANSGMSGTTAKTSFSQEEIEALDPDIIVDVLPSLAQTSEEFTKLLIPTDPKARPVIRKEIRIAGSKHNKLYKTRLAAINLNKDSFGSTEYLKPSIILRALLGVQNIEDVPPGSWRPDSIVYQINLAPMLRTVLISVADNADVDDDAYAALARLATDFPTAIAGQSFRKIAFDLCLDLLTQLSILHLRLYMADPNFNAENVVSKTFYDEPDEEGSMSFRHQNSLHLMALSEEDKNKYTDALSSRVADLYGPFEDNDPRVAWAAIRARFKWEDFVERVTQYYHARKAELDEQIQAVGGVQSIMLDLSAEVERRGLIREAELKRLSFSRPGGTPKQSFPKSNIQRLREMEPRKQATSTAPAAYRAAVAQMAEPSIPPAEQTAADPDDDWQRLEDDDYVDPATQAQSTARSTLAALMSAQEEQRQNAAKAKGRSYFDRQPNAVRVNFDDDSQDLTQYQVPDHYQRPAATAPANAPYFQSSRRLAPKRPLVQDDDDDFEPTQDPGFEVDRRDTAAADQRRRTVPQGRSVFAQFSTPAESSGAAASPPRTTADPNPSKRPRRNPGSGIPSTLPAVSFDEVRGRSQDEEWKHAKIAARQATVLTRTQRPPQQRKPWTEEEENRLITLIEEHGMSGVSYAKLKALDQDSEGGLARRSAEDMRFKARNMKETMLKAQARLPRNWEYVLLDRKAMDKLEAMGVVYEQDQVRSATVNIDTRRRSES